MSDDPSLAAPVEHFRCQPYATLLRRGACGERFVRMNRKGAAAPVLEERIRDGKCVACPVGEVHAAGGRHPDAARLPSPMVGMGAAPGRVVARTTARDAGSMVVAGMARRSMELSAARRAGVAPPRRPPGTAPRAPLPTPGLAAATREKEVRHASGAVTAPSSAARAHPPRAVELGSPTSTTTTASTAPAPAPKERSPMSRPAQMFSFNGKQRPLSAIATAIGINVEALRYRLKQGWTEVEAFGTPLGETRPSVVAASAPAPAKLAAKPLVAAPLSPPAKFPARSPTRAKQAARALPPPVWDPLAPRKLTAAEVLRWLGYQVDELELPGESDVLLRVRAS